LSTKQVRQLEEGGSSAFYNDSVKLTAAKKVGGLLGLSPDEVFVSSVAPAIETQVAETEAEVEADAPASVVLTPASETEVSPKVEHIETPVSSVASMPTSAELPDDEEAKPKTSIWAIAGLFAAALAVAAYMQPKEEAPVEPAPPLQVVPSEPDAAASAAEAAASAASTPADPTVPASNQKAASSPAVSASSMAPVAATTPGASAVRAPSVSASAPVIVRPANTASGAVPAAPSASKAP
jgi:hypothetical protein